MKPKSPNGAAERQPTEEEIRDYAYHLYCQGGYCSGHEMDNWLEAEACLRANIPKEHAHRRLHRHLSQQGVFIMPQTEARNLAI